MTSREQLEFLNSKGILSVQEAAGYWSGKFSYKRVRTSFSTEIKRQHSMETLIAGLYQKAEPKIRMFEDWINE